MKLISFLFFFFLLLIFSEGIIGDQLFVLVKPGPEITVGYVPAFILIFLPMLSTLLINFFLLKRKKQVVE